ncbi:hypothetical protein PPERSA_08079 [Pseudocohnilembus persalinus]|uniref:Uncharacterized protein n=1 Tax=Pseudocohnilembus persalinus TaxID=266149 RepID=A0A0V0R378_PSEPJ|nr:hypothetical protein PPERSA_08079 [Pseudocohnilembus persalinus]|eukprot:KRX08768.1 hypothetical protein PPERSA_08079 [Pseudocohnilembus persalinus]
MADFRTQEIIHLRAELQSIELDENRSQEEIQQIKNSLRILQKDKTDLLTDLDKSNLQTDQQSLKLKNLEKCVQNLRLDANQSESNLLQLEQFNDRLRSILKDKRDIQGDSDLQMRQNEERLKSLTQQYQDLDSQNKQVYLQSQEEQDKYQEQINIGKENAQNLNNVETTVRSKELHIDDLRNNYDVLKQKHFQLVDESKTQNEQMDLILSQIEQLNAKNKDLLQQLDIFQEQDEKVRSILDRKEQSQQLVEEMDLQLKESVAPILHLTRQG